MPIRTMTDDQIKVEIMQLIDRTQRTANRLRMENERLYRLQEEWLDRCKRSHDGAPRASTIDEHGALIQQLCNVDAQLRALRKDLGAESWNSPLRTLYDTLSVYRNAVANGEIQPRHYGFPVGPGRDSRVATDDFARSDPRRVHDGGSVHE